MIKFNVTLKDRKDVENLRFDIEDTKVNYSLEGKMLRYDNIKTPVLQFEGKEDKALSNTLVNKNILASKFNVRDILFEIYSHTARSKLLNTVTPYYYIYINKDRLMVEVIGLWGLGKFNTPRELIIPRFVNSVNFRNLGRRNAKLQLINHTNSYYEAVLSELKEIVLPDNVDVTFNDIKLNKYLTNIENIRALRGSMLYAKKDIAFNNLCEIDDYFTFKPIDIRCLTFLDNCKITKIPYNMLNELEFLEELRLCKSIEDIDLQYTGLGSFTYKRPIITAPKGSPLVGKVIKIERYNVDSTKHYVDIVIAEEREWDN